MLYRFAQWHALAKLRLHSESSVTFLAETFKNLSGMLRKFQRHTCAAFNAVELPKERAARQRKAAQHSETHNTSADSSGARQKTFNLSTYKFHAMGDYVRTIRFFGTTDSFTTQIVGTFNIHAMYLKFAQGELAHRALKAFYPLTNKLDTPAQLAKHERRRRVLQRVAEVAGTSSPGNQSGADALQSTSSEQQHHIATNRNNPVQIFAFIREHEGDPAVKVEVILDAPVICSQSSSEIHSKIKGPYPL